MNYWHELDLRAGWKARQEVGDKYLPWQQYIRILRDAPMEFPEADYVGRGIVIVAGGQFLAGAYVTVRLLREFGCELPIDIWHLGAAELPDVWRERFNGLAVTFCDAHEYQKLHPCGNLGGWQLKPYAIMLSRFDHVLFLDADNHPAKDPTHLFECDEFMEHGALFWPDRVRHGADSALWDIFGVPYRDEPQHETGQMVIDKGRHWQSLQLAMHVNENSAFHYKHSHGDTATFRFAMHACGEKFAVMPHRLIEVPVAREVEDIATLKDTPYMRKEGDLNALFLQRDVDGSVLFQHRTAGGGARAKFTLADARKLQHFQHHDLCVKYLEEAREAILGGSDWAAGMFEMHPEKISPHRRDGMAALFKAMTERDAKHIVETGTLRQLGNWHGDGGMTWWFARYAEAHDGHFCSIDNDPKAIEIAEGFVGGDRTDYICADSVEALGGYAGKIDVLYLDSVDYNAGHEGEAQSHSLREVVAAEPHMSEHGTIAIDDCKLAGGGKGGLSVPYLMGRGWHGLHDGYITVLGR